MKEIFYPVHWLPFILVLFQAYLFLAMSLFFLRRMKVLVPPVAGMDYGNVAVAGSLLLGALFISTGTTASIFQAARTLQYSNDHVLQNTLLKFTEYFIAGVLAVGVFLIAGFFNQRLFFKTSGDTNLNDGNLAWGVLIACINIGVAIVIWFWLKELAERITPEFVNFR